MFHLHHSRLIPPDGEYERITYILVLRDVVFGLSAAYFSQGHLAQLATPLVLAQFWYSKAGADEVPSTKGY